jgi:hypothetical protein
MDGGVCRWFIPSTSRTTECWDQMLCILHCLSLHRCGFRCGDLWGVIRLRVVPIHSWDWWGIGWLHVQLWVFILTQLHIHSWGLGSVVREPNVLTRAMTVSGMEMASQLLRTIFLPELKPINLKPPCRFPLGPSEIAPLVRMPLVVKRLPRENGFSTMWIVKSLGILSNGRLCRVARQRSFTTLMRRSISGTCSLVLARLKSGHQV